MDESSTATNTMWVLCGSDDPYEAFPPFMLASGALALDMDVNMFFTMKGLRILQNGVAEGIRLEGEARSLADYIGIVQEAGATLIACSAALGIVGIPEDDLIDGLEFGGVATFVNGAAEADLVLTF